MTQLVETGECSKKLDGSYSGSSTAGADSLRSLGDPESIRLFQNYVSNADPDSLAAMGGVGMSPNMVKTTTYMISMVKPDQLQRMFKFASSLNEKGSVNGDESRLRSKLPKMSPDMAKMASDMISKMSPEELQKMAEVASSLNMNASPFPIDTTTSNTQRSGMLSETSVAGSPNMGHSNSGASISGGLFPNSRIDAYVYDEEHSPEMMANMSEQFGVKLSKGGGSQSPAGHASTVTRLVG